MFEHLMNKILREPIEFGENHKNAGDGWQLKKIIHWWGKN